MQGPAACPDTSRAPKPPSRASFTGMRLLDMPWLVPGRGLRGRGYPRGLTLTVFPAVVGGHLRGGAVPPGLIVLVEAVDCHPQTVVGQHQEHMVQGSRKFFQLYRCGEKADRLVLEDIPHLSPKTDQIREGRFPTFPAARVGQGTQLGILHR